LIPSHYNVFGEFGNGIQLCSVPFLNRPLMSVILVAKSKELKMARITPDEITVSQDLTDTYKMQRNQ